MSGVGFAVVFTALPSPKFQEYVNGSPSGSTVPKLENIHVRAVHTGTPITGTGAALVAGLANETTRVVVAASPHASVTVSVTV